MSAEVSVVVPVYNVEKFLPKCLDSLINQTLKDIKIICVNDGSTDGSLDILNEYAKKDQRIVIVSKKNGGLSSARNAGLKECDTEYVMFCDSDDYFAERMCEKMLDAIKKDNSDLVVCGQNMIYQTHTEMEESDRNYYRLPAVGKNKITDELILKTNVSVTNKIFRMNTIRKYKIEFPEGMNNEDFYFYNAYMSVSESISFVHQKFYNYIRREGSIMSGNYDVNQLSLDHLLVTQKLFDFYKKTGFLLEHTDLFWRQWIASYWFSLEHSSKDTHNKVDIEAKRFINENFEKWPPRNDDTKKEVNYINNKNGLNKLKRKTRRVLADIYKRINIGYKQRNYVNQQLEKMMVKNEELLDRAKCLEGMVKEK